MAVALADIKAYMRIDPADTTDDVVIQNLATAAAAYLGNAGIAEPASNAELYALAVKSLTLHWYDNRDAVSAGTVSVTPLGLDTIIVQLQCKGLSANEEAAT